MISIAAKILCGGWHFLVAERFPHALRMAQVLAAGLFDRVVAQFRDRPLPGLDRFLQRRRIAVDRGEDHVVQRFEPGNHVRARFLSRPVCRWRRTVRVAIADRLLHIAGRGKLAMEAHDINCP